MSNVRRDERSCPGICRRPPYAAVSAILPFLLFRWGGEGVSHLLHEYGRVRQRPTRPWEDTCCSARGRPLTSARGRNVPRTRIPNLQVPARVVCHKLRERLVETDLKLVGDVQRARRWLGRGGCRLGT